MSTTNGGNGSQAAPQAGSPAATAPQLNVMAQYIKDLSFENPNPRALGTQQQQPAINIQVAVNANPINDSDIEVILKIEGKAELPNKTVMFSFELEYGGAFRIQNVPQESLHAVVMIECPRLLFPFAREIIASTVAAGGFPPLLLNPVDFVGLYQQNLARMQPAGSPPVQQA
jgi:preprotein translocase subunit SecB